MSISRTPSHRYRADEAFALKLDAEDPLAAYRDRFAVPRGPDGKQPIYFCGNSLGLMPKSARDLVVQELDDWATLGVAGHFEARTPWYSYHEEFSDPLAELTGSQPHEVVAMNGLTVNLHLMMVSFYRPTSTRYKILIEHSAFPSDRYAVQSQIAWHGFDPAGGVVEACPREGEDSLRTEDIEALIEQRGDEIALVLVGGVNFYTGQLLDMPRIVAAAHHGGCPVGLDLAHAIGNVPLALHDWDADFAVWCSYKYLNGGPGSIGGCFVHERHGRNLELPRFAGWWGNDPEMRFRMPATFTPREGADGWQLSNPPILSMAALRPSLTIFSEAGITALRRKSIALTGLLEYLVSGTGNRAFELITPREPDERGCQLSFRVTGGGRSLFKALSDRGVVVDLREPDVIRVAPVPLYNTFHEVWRFGEVLGRAVPPSAVSRSSAGE